MKVGFTGTQVGMTGDQCQEFVAVMDELKPKEFHHGDCMGADAQAHDLVRQYFPWVLIVVHPPSNPDKRAFKLGDDTWSELPYTVRNKEIVAATEALVAAPRQLVEVTRSGTWMTIRQARWQGKPVHLLLRRDQ